ncbi:hypothetical protein B0J12DRAFT_675788 [Macrophomina phaseolina]|uniref:Uncharacterized protein n=1 Tax=Macrophomina phaseolina TaxID=35725 RepID=A0ABQ8G0Q9_9PEZI|nr:hypothetical protein B0J12DRAFT_675788 [Macrophomina phaseolina]
MPGSLAQMLLFNIVVVTVIGEWARYKVRRCSSSSLPSSTGAMKEDLEAGEGEDENDQQQERGGKAASYAHWEFAETACGEAWRVLVVAGMAFALLVVELDYVSGV